MIASAQIGRRLPLGFDDARLLHDLSLVRREDWSPHYNEQDFGGAWEAVSLRSESGSVCDIDAGRGTAEFRDTKLLERCAYFRETMAAFHCELKAVRLLSLAPGSFIREHTDDGLGFEQGEVRLHIPIQTNPQVEFYVCGERLNMAAGGCFYVNVHLPHRVSNRGTQARVHLVIDAVVNDWVREVFGRAGEIERSEVPPHGFAEFATAVFADDALRERLSAIEDRRDLLHAVVKEAARLGFDLNEADIQSAFRASASAGVQVNEDWVPVSVARGERGPTVKWIYAPGHRFTAPFYEDDIRALLWRPFTALFQRETQLTARRRIAPAGFIFHMSRCGSTLVSRSLAAATTTHVISEAAPIDQVLRTGNAEWLEQIVSALGRPGMKYLVKLDAWHIYNLPLIRAVYPDTPWIFVSRDLDAVLASQLRQPGLHGIPGGMNLNGASLAEWYSQTLTGFRDEAERFRAEPRGMFVDYKELPEAICGCIASHFGLNLSPEDEQLVQAATAFDAKNPYALFQRGI